MHRFLVVIEKGENNYSAYSPDLPDASPLVQRVKRPRETCTKLS